MSHNTYTNSKEFHMNEQTDFSLDIFRKEVFINVSYNNEEGVFKFDYCDSAGSSCALLDVHEKCVIVYILNDNTGCDLSFYGIAFSNPFNGIITDAKISNNGKQIYLYDPFEKCESKNDEDFSVSFEFMFTYQRPPSGVKYQSKKLLLISSDPEIANKGETCPPPSH